MKAARTSGRDASGPAAQLLATEVAELFYNLVSALFDSLPARASLHARARSQMAREATAARKHPAATGLWPALRLSRHPLARSSRRYKDASVPNRNRRLSFRRLPPLNTRESKRRALALATFNSARGDRLPGWACRTRTCESVRELSDWNPVTTSPEVGQAWRRRLSRASCVKRICSSGQDFGRRSLARKSGIITRIDWADAILHSTSVVNRACILTGWLPPMNSEPT